MDNPWPSYYAPRQTSYEDLSQQLDDISNYIQKGGLGIGGNVPKEPSDIARAFISQSWKSSKTTKKELANFAQFYKNQILKGTMDPAEGGYAYLNLARSVGARPGKTFQATQEIFDTPMGFAPAESYERYKPAASLAFEQLLGRNLSDTEFKNYVSAAQGLGISKGADFQAFLGETLLSSPEYKSKAVVFNPQKVADAIKAFQ